jgi:hypothetical protein
MKKLILFCLWASVLGANAQAIDLKKNEIYINGKLVGKVENKDAWDTMKFYDLNGILRFMILPKKVDFQNNINYWNLYTHPQTRKTVELLKKHARLFKPKLGESEVMVKYGILSENGFVRSARFSSSSVQTLKSFDFLMPVMNRISIILIYRVTPLLFLLLCTGPLMAQERFTDSLLFELRSSKKEDRKAELYMAL